MALCPRRRRDNDVTDVQTAREIRALMNSEEPRTETKMRQDIMCVCMMGELLYVQVQFDPFGTPYHPAINGKPADVAKWLRTLADDIESLGT